MVYITGDTHGEEARFSEDYIPGESGFTEEDTVLVTGDFQFIFKDDTEQEKALDRLAEKKYEICFIDGNHEKFPTLFAYPEVSFRGGRAREIRKNIHYLIRGEVFSMEGKSYFVFGGAFSLNSPYLTTGVDHFTEEIPVDEDYENAKKNLECANYSVDYVITHQAPTSVLLMLGQAPHPADRRLDDYMEELMHKLEYKKWYFGHWHDDREISDKMTLLWFDCKRAGD